MNENENIEKKRGGISIKKWLRQLNEFGITELDFQARKKKLLEKPGNWSDSDVIWSLFNEVVVRTQDSHHRKMIYYSMALFLNDEGRDPIVSLRESARIELQIHERHGITHVGVSATSDSCEACKQLEKKTFSIVEALENNPLPCKECTHLLDKKSQRGFCRCSYIGLVEGMMSHNVL